jgi:hypothetical protein
LEPGERIDLIRRLTARVRGTDFDWEERELVLRQFGFSTSEPTVIADLETGTDESLVDLDEYLFGGSSRSTLDPGDLPWQPGTFRLFISHTSEHAALGGELREILATWRMDGFVAHETIEPTHEWEREIEAALGSCHAMTALITHDFIASRWCDQEVGYCLARKIPIVPVKLDTNPHGFIAKYQAATAAWPGTAPWIADAIFRALARHSAIRGLMAGPVVYRYAASRSIDGARANFDLLRGLSVDVWTRELVATAERATAQNSQIASAAVLEPESKSMRQAAAELFAPLRDALGMNTPPPVADDEIPF